MQNKRIVHNSGPLGMLIRNGQVTKIDVTNLEDTQKPVDSSEKDRLAPSYFRTQTGIDFNEHELVFVDPKECEPWEFANRSAEEMGEMDELIQSIQENKQLQPALVRPHPKPHDGIKYEIIFGRRRHQACLTLNIPFMVIRREINNIQEAIAKQDAENKSRKGVSNYSNAILYKKLLDKGIFNSEKELAAKLNLPASSLNDLMSFAKIPSDIILAIPGIHSLSISMALKIITLLNTSKKNHAALLTIAPYIGTSITSPVKLENAIKLKPTSSSSREERFVTKLFSDKDGNKLFTFRVNHRGSPSISFNKEATKNLDFKLLCEHLIKYLEQTK